jgi:hypothetical protein
MKKSQRRKSGTTGPAGTTKSKFQAFLKYEELAGGSERPGAPRLARLIARCAAKDSFVIPAARLAAEQLASGETARLMAWGEAAHRRGWAFEDALRKARKGR